MKRIKADELEMSVTYRAMRVSYVFMVLAIIGYCIYHCIRFNESPHFHILILCIQGILFFVVRLFLLRKMTMAEKEEI